MIESNTRTISVVETVEIPAFAASASATMTNFVRNNSQRGSWFRTLKRDVLSSSYIRIAIGSAMAFGSPAFSAPATAQVNVDPSPNEDAVVSIEKITQVHMQSISRFSAPVCLKVISEDQPFAQAVADRFEEDVRHLPLKIAGRYCTPNIKIVISSEHEHALRQFINQHGTAADNLSGAHVGSKIQNANVVVWSNGTAPDMKPADHHYISIRLSGHEFRNVDVEGGEASLLKKKSPGQAAILIVDSAMIKGRTPSQIADYAAMRLLGQTTDTPPSVQSILRLFQPDRPVPNGLTSFDQAYLDQLFAAPINLSTSDFIRQAGPLVQHAAEPLITAPKPTSKPIGEVDERAEATLEATDSVIDPQAAEPSEKREAAEAKSLAANNWTKDIVVVGHKEGPALWRVQKGGSTITILGTVAPLPLNLEWQDWRVKAAIRRSRLMLINSEPEANLIWMRSWSPTAAEQLYQPKGQTIAAEVSPDMEKHLSELAEAAGQTIDRYKSLRPGAAAILLNADWREHSGYSNATLGRSLATYARKHHVVVRYIRQIALLPTIDEFPRMTQAAQINCLGRIMGGIENERTMGNLQASNWAVGDVGDLRRHYLTPAQCSSEIREDDQRRGAAIAAWTALLLKALDRKETRSFAMVDLSSLLRQDGILMQLRQAGAVIDIPPDEAE